MQNNADPDLIENESGWSALMMACRNDHKENVEMLLNKSVNVNLHGYNGTSALMIGLKNFHSLNLLICFYIVFMNLY